MKTNVTNEIAAWRIECPLEKYLSRKADNSLFWKKVYVCFYKIFDKKYYDNGLRFINNNINLFIGDISQSQKKTYILDMVYSLHRFGCMFDEYFLYNFPSLNTEGRESFITDKTRWEYYSVANPNAELELFNDKKKCYDRFNNYFRRELILIESEKDKEEFVEFVSRHNTFIIKPYNSSGGRGVLIQTATNNNFEKCFYDLISLGGKIICEELIKQSDTMSSLHPSSVNTLRIATIKQNEEVHLFHPLLRIGVGKAVVDNASSGGIFALVNPETGIVYTEAKDEKGGCFLSHPDTGLIFPGFQIPDWEEAVKLVKELAMSAENFRYVGWDLAHTENGWVLVEGNPRGQLVMMQLFYRNGFKKEFESYLV